MKAHVTMHTGTDLIREYELVRTRPGTVYSVIGHKARAGDLGKHASNEMPLHMRDLVYLYGDEHATNDSQIQGTCTHARERPEPPLCPSDAQSMPVLRARRYAPLYVSIYTRGARHKAALIHIALGTRRATDGMPHTVAIATASPARMQGTTTPTPQTQSPFATHPAHAAAASEHRAQATA